MDERLKSYRGLVSGLVQGVGFRYFVCRQALSLDLRGWVMNRSDGTVEFQVEGPQIAVNDLLQRVRKGPIFSRVEDLKVQDVDPEGPTTFQIRYE